MTLISLLIKTRSKDCLHYKWAQTEAVATEGRGNEMNVFVFGCFSRAHWTRQRNCSSREKKRSIRWLTHLWLGQKDVCSNEWAVKVCYMKSHIKHLTSSSFDFYLKKSVSSPVCLSFTAAGAGNVDHRHWFPPVVLMGRSGSRLHHWTA